MRPAGETFSLTIRAEGRHSAPAIARLPALLKALLRVYGFKVVTLTPAIDTRSTEKEVDAWLTR